MNGLNIQGGISLSYSLRIVAAYSATDFALEADEQRYSRYYEGGLNYFRSVGTNGKLEMTATAGKGSAEAEQLYDRLDSGEYTKVYLQGSGSLKSNNFEGGASLRLANIYFTEFESTHNSENLSSESLFFEPAAFVSFGSKNIKLESQLGYSFSLTKPSELAFDYEFVRLTVGIRFILNRY